MSSPKHAAVVGFKGYCPNCTEIMAITKYKRLSRLLCEKLTWWLIAQIGVYSYSYPTS